MKHLYLDSSIFGHSANERAVKFYANANKLLEQVDLGLFMGYISDTVLDEVNAAPGWIKVKVQGKIDECELLLLNVTKEIKKPADEYITEGIVPSAKRPDALHIATAVVNGLDMLVSYNYEHLVKPEVEEGVNKINKKRGYSTIRIVSPEEII